MAEFLNKIGDVFIDVGLERLKQKFGGGSAPISRATTQPIVRVGGPDFGGSGSPIGIPFGEIVGDPGMTPGRHYLRWDKKLQQWVKHAHRRRRRRLLTDSDYDDLLRISTLPNSKSIQVALSKTLRR